MKFARTALAALFAVGIALSAHADGPKVIKKVPPEFPAEAQRAGVNAGTVTAKVTIEADGKVSNVEIVQAQPKRLFDHAVTEALMDWRYEASGAKQTSEVKLVFKNDDE